MKRRRFIQLLAMLPLGGQLTEVLTPTKTPRFTSGGVVPNGAAVLFFRPGEVIVPKATLAVQQADQIIGKVRWLDLTEIKPSDIDTKPLT